MTTTDQLDSQILFDIAMSIGNSWDLHEMVGEALRTYLRQLDCAVGAVYRYTDNGGVELVLSLPPDLQGHPVSTAVSAELDAHSLPLESATETEIASAGWAYLLPLDSYGFLALHRTEARLGEQALTDLSPVNSKLATSCLAREHYAQMEAGGRAERAGSHIDSSLLLQLGRRMHPSMRAVVEHARRLMDAPLAEAEHNTAKQLLDTSSGMLELIDHIVEFAELAVGEIDVDLHDVDVRTELRSMVDLLQPVAVERGTTLSLELAADFPPRFTLDMQRLHQLLLKLLSNALKFTDRGSVKLRADFRAPSPDQPRLRLVVADTGVGMDSATLTAAFQPLQRVNSTGEVPAAGSGLGLAIAQALVTQLGGTMSVDSRLGEGSTFTIELPVSETDSLFVVTDANSDDESSDLTGIRVLVVDDDPTNRLVLEETLRLLDVEPVSVENGRLAVDLVQAETFDLVFMDVQMPILDGISATELIRRHERENGVVRGIPIIALTAHSMAQHREQCLAAGMNAYTTKPVGMDELESLVAGWARHGDAPPVNAEPETPAPHSGYVADPYPVLDLGALSQTLGEDDAALKQVLSCALPDLDRELDRLAGAIAAGDLLEVARLAHRIKGVAANLRAQRLRTAASDLEIVGKNAGPAAVIERYRALMSEYSVLRERITEALHR